MKRKREKTGNGSLSGAISLRKGIYRILVFGWLVPVLALFAVGIWFMSSRQVSQAEKSVVTSSDNASGLVSMRISDCVRASRDASYLPVLSNAYRQYRNESAGGNTGELYNIGTTFLKQMYKSNRNISCSILFFTASPDVLCYSLEGNSYASYSDIQYYQSNVHSQVQELSETLDTGIQLIRSGNHVYMVRNLMDSSFHPYAVLIFELDTDELFGSLRSVWGSEGYLVTAPDGTVFASFGSASVSEGLKEELADDPARSGSVFWRRGADCTVYRTIRTDAGDLCLISLLSAAVIFEDFRTLLLIFCLLPLFLIPILFLISRYLRRHVTEPVDAMVDGFGRIEKEEYGYHISQDAQNREFLYLENSFNKMSDRLKQQFENIYLEQLKLRDARIMALQLQINPHFLNNTLEIINWEARLGDTEKVSGMIEALSVMLSATMNRNRRRRVELREELSYMDAYLYIIRERLGDDRFSFSENVPPDLLDALVPQFIIQPLVENAVEHGMDPDFGTVSLTVTSRGDVLIIDVTDNGRLTEEQREKIHGILNEDIETMIQSGKRTSVGIRNVNQRLKILYGEGFGLTIEPDEEGNTRSRMLLKLERAEM